MSESGFFSRLSNLWTGFLSLWVSDLEKQNPEIAYENSINSMTEKYAMLKKATASIIRRREELSDRLQKRQKELEQVDADLNTAVDTEQDDLAIVLISKKDALDSEILELTAELERSAAEGEDAKRALMNVQAEINKLKAEKDRMLAKMQSAQARIKIQDQLEGLSVDAEVKALENVRDHINGLEAEAKLGKELAGESLDSKLAELRRQTGDVSSKKKLEELKAKRQAAKAAQASKTM
ncbi:MAG: PspA/IM30 family protein [Myxococcota bacterium]|nr:PspA/IM30 family protein [Myxococcota bacterium]